LLLVILASGAAGVRDGENPPVGVVRRHTHVVDRATGTNRAAAGPATWRSLFATAEYRALWGANLVSLLGDQLARVAVAVLVFERTGSALLTAMAYAVTLLPWVIGGPLLGGLADRYPRRAVMISCNLLSAVLVGLLAAPAMPIVLVCAVLFLAVLAEAPFRAARAALLVDVLPDDRYVLAIGVGSVTSQAAQVAGFAAGGALVALIGPRPALLVDAATFVVSAAVVRWGIRPRRPAVAATSGAGVAGWARRLRGAVRTVFGDPRLRGLTLLAWLATFTVVPEGLAAPYAAMFDGSPTTVGLLMAADPAGAVLGGVLLTRLVGPSRRLRLLVPLAVASCVPLVLCAAQPPLALALALLAACGLASSYQLVANAAFMQSVAAGVRGQAFGLATAGLVAGQGLGIALAGAVADRFDPPYVIAGAGALGLLVIAAVVPSLGARSAVLCPQVAR
jgi:MFS family permease